jgi:hypothetical protein
MLLVMGRFSPLTGITGADVVIDKTPHLGPVVVSRDNLVDFGLTKMSGDETIMSLPQDLRLDGLKVWNVDVAVVEKELVLHGEGLDLGLDGGVTR